ncbi:MAG: undecaprenyl-phosphate alpha-N-acetylglucosaminyl 1-phosphate transferase [Saprospiraceae bacterium]|nr:MAG: undecaprenyl-phosphate alpha-N-acetylglucosaminyl 1-phosphate transferase [Saprospiraceae bacterium]
MDTLQLTGTFLFAFFISMASIPVIIHWAHSRGLLDKPSHRKVHTEQVSNLGGVAIFTAWMVTLGCFLWPSAPTLLKGVALAFPLFALALLDDLTEVGVTTRLVFQALTGVLAFDMGFQVVILENEWMLNLVATVLLFMVLVNAFNLIDGINGLAGSLGLIGGLAFACFFISMGWVAPALVALAYSGALSGFLYYNFRRRARIFMGDNGSVVMGYFMAFMIIQVLEHPVAIHQASLTVVQFGVSTIMLPVVDMGRVFICRMLRGQSPFYGDRTHIHHYFVDNGFSHPVASSLLACAHVSIVLAGALLSFGWWLMVCAASIGGIYLLAMVVNASQRPVAVPNPGSSFEEFQVPV